MRCCYWCEYFTCRRIMNFTPLVVVMVGRNKLEKYASKSSRLIFCENMRNSDFRDPQKLSGTKPQSHETTKQQGHKAAEP